MEERGRFNGWTKLAYIMQKHDPAGIHMTCIYTCIYKYIYTYLFIYTVNLEIFTAKKISATTTNDKIKQVQYFIFSLQKKISPTTTNDKIKQAQYFIQ